MADLRLLPAVLSGSSLQAWSDLNKVRLHQEGRGCILVPVEDGAGIEFPLLPGCVCLEALPTLDGEGMGLQEFVVQSSPTKGGRRTRLRSHCLLDISCLDDHEVSDLLDWCAGEGLVQPEIWHSGDEHAWLHVEAAPHRNLPDRTPVHCAVLHGDAPEGPFLPPGQEHPFAQVDAARFLPAVASGHALIWLADQGEGVLKHVATERRGLATELAWPSFSDAQPTLRNVKVRGEVVLRLEQDRRPSAVRLAESCRVVMHLVADHDASPGVFLDLLDDGDAGIRDMRHFCLGEQSPYAKVYHYFETKRAVPLNGLRQAGLDAVYLQPSEFDELDIPVFVRLGVRLWPGPEWILGRAEDVESFRSQMVERLGIGSVQEDVILLDAGMEPGDPPRVTKLCQGRPVLESVDLLLKPWQSKNWQQRTPDLPVVEAKAYDHGTEALDALSVRLRTEFEASLEGLFSDLDAALKAVAQKAQQAQGHIERAEQLHEAATGAVEPVGSSWTEFMERVFELNEHLQDARFAWIEGAKSLHSRLAERLEIFGRAQVDLEQVAQEVWDLLQAEKADLNQRDGSIRSCLGHVSRIAGEIEKDLGPKYEQSLRGLGARVAEVTLALTTRQRELASQRQALTAKTGDLEQNRRRLESEVEELEQAKRELAALEAVVKELTQRRDSLLGLKEQAAAMRQDVEKRKRETDRLEEEANRAMEQAKLQNKAQEIRERNLKELVARLEREQQRVRDLERELKDLGRRRDAANVDIEKIPAIEKEVAATTKRTNKVEAEAARLMADAERKKREADAKEQTAAEVRREAEGMLASAKVRVELLEKAIHDEVGRRNRLENLIALADSLLDDMQAAGVRRSVRWWRRWLPRWRSK